MLVVLRNDRQIELMLLNETLHKDLCLYLDGLSKETLKRFGPHGFDAESLEKLYQPGSVYTGYIALDPASGQIIAYAIIKKGYLEHDASRLTGYGLNLSHTADCTFAPVVAAAWQGLGVGDQLFAFVYKHEKENGFKRIILWGGVQATNEPALRFYSKNGFKMLGQFTYKVENYDMLFEIK